MSATDMPFEGHEAIVAALRAGELGAPETLRERILAAAPGTKRQRTPMSRRRKLVLLVPIAAGLAVGAAVIHGALFSGRSPALTAAGPLVLSHGQFSRGINARVPKGTESAVVKHAPSTYQAYKGTKSETQTLAALSRPSADSFSTANSGTAIGSSYNAPALTADAAGANATTGLSGVGSVVIPRNRLVHADASLQVVVRSHAALTKATDNASQIVTSLGGYAQSVQYQATRTGDGSAFLDLRVPVGKAETAIGRLEALGKLFSQQVSTQDLQQQFGKQTNVIGRLKREIAIYEQALSSGTLSGSQRVDVQIHLANAEHSLTSERKARSHTVSSAATASIQLQLTTNQHAFAVGPHKRGRFGRLLHNAAGFLALEGIIVLYILIVAGPIAILIALGWWLRRERRRRDERTLLAST